VYIYGYVRKKIIDVFYYEHIKYDTYKYMKKYVYGRKSIKIKFNKYIHIYVYICRYIYAYTYMNKYILKFTYMSIYILEMYIYI
jgi:hypothetical protein